MWDIFLQEIWSKFQFGLDVVTPLVFLGGLLKWISIRKNEKTDRVNEERSRLSKVGAFEALTKVIDRAANMFSAEVATTCVSLEDFIGRYFVQTHEREFIESSKPGVLERWYSKKMPGLDADEVFDYYFDSDKTRKIISLKVSEINSQVETLVNIAVKNLKDFYFLAEASKYSINPLLRMIYVEKANEVSSGQLFSEQAIRLLEGEVNSIWLHVINIESSLEKIRILGWRLEKNAASNDSIEAPQAENLVSALWILLFSVFRARRCCKSVCIYYSALLEHITLERDSSQFGKCLEDYKKNIFLLEDTIR